MKNRRDLKNGERVKFQTIDWHWLLGTVLFKAETALWSIQPDDKDRSSVYVHRRACVPCKRKRPQIVYKRTETYPFSRTIQLWTN